MTRKKTSQHKKRHRESANQPLEDFVLTKHHAPGSSPRDHWSRPSTPQRPSHNPNYIEVARRRRITRSPSADSVANMAPATPASVEPEISGPHPSFIEVAKPYIFEQKLQQCMTAIGRNEAKEDNVRLQGVSWIDNVRKTLQLPVRTYNTAVVYYHKFRLVHADNEYSYSDAAAAALFTACKIEDTLKKSREILCAAYNMRLAAAEQLSSDDPMFDQHSKAIIGLERLMLEASGFDFRSRHPQKLVIKLVKSCGLDRETAGKTAYNMSVDLYRTFAPLKQTTATMAIACVELAARLCEADLTRVHGDRGIKYERWGTSREEVMETLLDLLDLYTHHRASTVVGPDHPLDTFINIRITLNQEASSSNLPRYTHWEQHSPKVLSSTSKAVTNGVKRMANGTPKSPHVDRRDAVTTVASPASPASAVGARGQSGTVRFMLDAGRARNEKSAVAEYFKVEEEEYEVEIEVESSRSSTRRR